MRLNIDKLDVLKLKLSNGVTIEEAFISSAKQLKECIYERLSEYYYSYSPSNYSRSYSLLNSLEADNFVTVKGSTLIINVSFNDKANHPSGYGVWADYGSTNVNTAYLMNYGYTVNKPVWFKDIHHFGHKDPAHFIENGVRDFLDYYNRYNLSVEIHKPDTYYV